MKIVYMGTPEIAKVCLEKLYTEGFDIAAVYTKPDTPKNRGMKLIPSEVKAYAVSVGLPVVQPQTFKDDAVIEQLRAFAPDLAQQVQISVSQGGKTGISGPPGRKAPAQAVGPAQA